MAWLLVVLARFPRPSRINLGQDALSAGAAVRQVGASQHVEKNYVGFLWAVKPIQAGPVQGVDSAWPRSLQPKGYVCTHVTDTNVFCVLERLKRPSPEFLSGRAVEHPHWVLEEDVCVQHLAVRRH